MNEADEKRVKAACESIFKCLRAKNAKVEVVENSAYGRPAVMVNNIKTYLDIGMVGRFPPGGSALRLKFGGWGPRQVLSLREPKSGFKYPIIAARILAWTEEEQARLDKNAAEVKVRAANTRRANRIIRVCSVKKDDRFTVSGNGAVKDTVSVRLWVDDISESVATKLIQAVQKIVGKDGKRRYPRYR